MLSRYECVKLLVSKITDELMVTTLSGVYRELYNAKHRDGNFYHVYLSGASAVALGLAAALPHRKVICLDADGSILMDLSVLPAIAKRNPSNLIVIVFDNESYASCNIPSFTAGATDLAGIAREAGIPNAGMVKEAAEYEKTINDAFRANGASFIVVKVKPEGLRLPLPPFEGIENKYRFIRYVEQTENIQIIKPRKPRSLKDESTISTSTKG